MKTLVLCILLVASSAEIRVGSMFSKKSTPPPQTKRSYGPPLPSIPTPLQYYPHRATLTPKPYSYSPAWNYRAPGIRGTLQQKPYSNNYQYRDNHGTRLEFRQKPYSNDWDVYDRSYPR